MSVRTTSCVVFVVRLLSYAVSNVIDVDFLPRNNVLYVDSDHTVLYESDLEVRFNGHVH